MSLAPFNQERRSLALSYLLWCAALVGVCGLQRFYNRKPLSGLLWLFTFGLCGIGQLIDLVQMPSLVRQANRDQLLEAGKLESLAVENRLLSLARRSGSAGFTLNDAVLELQHNHAIESGVVREEIQRLLQDGLLDVGNDLEGRVVYREP